MAAEAVFVDTNVLVRASATGAPRHDDARRLIADLAAGVHPLWLSRQIVREYLAVMTRPQTFAQPLPLLEAIADVRDFLDRFTVAEDGPAVTPRLLDLLQRTGTGGRQVHDANIVATMLEHGIARLLTFNVADFRRFVPVIELVPT